MAGRCKIRWRMVMGRDTKLNHGKEKTIEG